MATEVVLTAKPLIFVEGTIDVTTFQKDQTEMTSADRAKSRKFAVRNENTVFGQFYLACRQHHETVAASMLNKPDLYDMETNGQHPFHVAAYFNCKKLLQTMLTEHKVDVNLPSFNGKTAVHYAASGGAVESVQFLITEAKANGNKRDNAGQLPTEVLFPSNKLTEDTKRAFGPNCAKEIRNIRIKIITALKGQVDEANEVVKWFATQYCDL